MTPRRRSKDREIRAVEPGLSAEANARLTDELRAVTGDDRVRVPAGTPAVPRAHHGRHGPVAEGLIRHRVAVGITLLMLVAVAGIVSLATGSLWALPVAILLHAGGTVAVLALTMQLTAEQEHAAPQTAALLEEEGVADPDALLTELARDVERARDGAPPPAGDGMPASQLGLCWVPPVVVGGAVVVAGTAPLVVDDGWMWVAPAVVWPAAILWAVVSYEPPPGPHHRA